MNLSSVVLPNTSFSFVIYSISSDKNILNFRWTSSVFNIYKNTLHYSGMFHKLFVSSLFLFEKALTFSHFEVFPN